MKRVIVSFLLLTLLSFAAAGQVRGGGASVGGRSASKMELPGGKLSVSGMGLAGAAGTTGVVGAAGDPLPSGYKDYEDEGFEDFAREMKERGWGREDTAWQLACDANSKQSYERYMSMYPSGAHIAEASCRLVDAQVDEMLANAHNSLPNIIRTEPDDESLKSTVIIKNNTGYPLTVYYSGLQSRSVIIQPDGKATVTLDNGPYKLGASVPPSYIHPFAGKTSLEGGVYEIGFWVVTR